MHRLQQILLETWMVWTLMAPYLLLGFLAAGLLAVVLSPAWVSRHLGGHGLGQVVKATLLGIPLPLCSCGVLPVATSLRNQGAGKSATVGFLTSAPQIGVNSLIATYAVLGPVVALFRVLAAFFSGVLAGSLVFAVCPEKQATSSVPEQKDAITATSGWRRMLRLGLVTLPRDIARPLFVGVLLSGLFTTFLPAGFLEGHLPPGWKAYALALLVGMPLYICSTASIPLAASFIYMGATPGAAMAFLIAGPATNASTLAVMWRRIGKLETALYLAAIAGTAAAAGWMLDLFFAGRHADIPALRASCESCAGSWWGIAAGVLLLILALPALLPEKARGFHWK